ncbi:MAG: hypothetical protein JEZ02_13500 [Desulfatibacillum sp.]|nr:hypothetical protein [Desulfatibacillum sp.]
MTSQEDLIELKVRQSIAKEVSEYREHLETQFKQLKWGLTILIGFVLIVFVWVYGNSYNEMNNSVTYLTSSIQNKINMLEKYAEQQASNRIVDYKVDAALEKRISIRINEISDAVINQNKKDIEKLVSNNISTFLNDQANLKLAEVLDLKVNELKSFDVNGLLLVLPVGTIIPSMLSPDKFAQLPEGTKWTLANGRSVPNTRYAELVGPTVPDLRGMFLRGLNEGRTDGKQDPDNNRKPGDEQDQMFKEHFHNFYSNVYDAGGGDNASWVAHDPGAFGYGHINPPPTKAAGGEETRPNNVAVYYYIKIN